MGVCCVCIIVYVYKILAVEMDYLREGSRISRLDRVKNEIKHRIKSLKWFGHVMKKEENMNTKGLRFEDIGL